MYGSCPGTPCIECIIFVLHTHQFIIFTVVLFNRRCRWHGHSQTVRTCCFDILYFHSLQIRNRNHFSFVRVRPLSKFTRIAESTMFAWNFRCVFIHCSRWMALETLFLICFAILSACMSTNYSWCAIVCIKGNRPVIFVFSMPARHMNGQTHVKLCARKKRTQFYSKDIKTTHLFIHRLGTMDLGTSLNRSWDLCTVRYLWCIHGISLSLASSSSLRTSAAGRKIEEKVNGFQTGCCHPDSNRCS